MALQNLPPPQSLVFLDETGANRSMTKRQAWAPVGVRATDHVPGNKGKNVTLIGAMRLAGPVVMRTMLEGLKKDSFANFICKALAPKLKPGDVVIMDNLRVHYDSQALKAIESAGAFYLFLPPYSPDLNPIEMLFNALKRRFERAGANSAAQVRSALAGAWRSLKKLDLSAMFAACGYHKAPQPI
jgi:transposase